ncbi:MAG: hypothetical protein IT497_09230 [Ottowia sp.]|nr:hypothetical protein [Ottowia sp.]
MEFFKKIKSIFSPRYTLHLDETCLETLNLEMYRLKVYGGHGHVEADYHKILNTPGMCTDISPKDLIKIAIHNYQRKQVQKKIYICEIMRDRQYKIFLNGQIRVLSGKKLMNDKTLLDRLRSADISMVAYQEGFSYCREAGFSENESAEVAGEKILYLRR